MNTDYDLDVLALAEYLGMHPERQHEIRFAAAQRMLQRSDVRAALDTLWALPRWWQDRLSTLHALPERWQERAALPIGWETVPYRGAQDLRVRLDMQVQIYSKLAWSTWRGDPVLYLADLYVPHNYGPAKRYLMIDALCHIAKEHRITIELAGDGNANEAHTPHLTYGDLIALGTQLGAR